MNKEQLELQNAELKVRLEIMHKLFHDLTSAILGSLREGGEIFNESLRYAQSVPKDWPEGFSPEKYIQDVINPILEERARRNEPQPEQSTPPEPTV